MRLEDRRTEPAEPERQRVEQRLHRYRRVQTQVAFGWRIGRVARLRSGREVDRSRKRPAQCADRGQGALERARAFHRMPSFVRHASRQLDVRKQHHLGARGRDGLRHAHVRRPLLLAAFVLERRRHRSYLAARSNPGNRRAGAAARGPGRARNARARRGSAGQGRRRRGSGAAGAHRRQHVLHVPELRPRHGERHADGGRLSVRQRRFDPRRRRQCDRDERAARLRCRRQRDVDDHRRSAAFPRRFARHPERRRRTATAPRLSSAY